ncbi:MAG: caspase family protein [Flavobacterium sp.]
MSDLERYKQHRINELTTQFNSNLGRAFATLQYNVRTIQSARFVSNAQKTARVNARIQQYNRDIANLRSLYTSAVQSVAKYVPEFNNNAAFKRRKALLIGVNYLNTPYALSGCINDTQRMSEFLSKRSFDNIQTITDLTSIKPTKTAILTAFRQLISTSQSGDLLFFYFSGHGSYTFDRSGDETDGRDEMIVSSDLQGILDDDFQSILRSLLPKDVTLIGLFDSCHSGTMFDLKYSYDNGTNYDQYTENPKVSAECKGNVLMLSGCMDAQTSAEALIEQRVQGAMSYVFMESLQQSPNSSWRELLRAMRVTLHENGFEQTPQLTTDSFYDVDSRVFL